MEGEQLHWHQGTGGQRVRLQQGKLGGGRQGSEGGPEQARRGKYELHVGLLSPGAVISFEEPTSFEQYAFFNQKSSETIPG